MEVIERLREREKTRIDRIYRPHQYEKPSSVPAIVKKKPRIFTAGSRRGSANPATFGYNNHASWEQFKDSLGTKQYQTTVQGRLYPKRHSYATSTDFVKAADKV